MAEKVHILDFERDSQLWDGFVSAQTGASFCHLSSWKTIIEGAYGHTCYYLYCQQEGSITGVLPLVHVRGLLAPNRLVSVPFLDQGGILASNEQTFGILLEAGLELARKVGAKGIDLRHSTPASESQPLQNRRYRFVVPLPESSEELWNSLGSKVRNQIRKSEKSGLKTSIAPSRELASFFGVFSRNMRDLGSPTHSERFFTLMADALDQEFALYITSAADGSVVAGAIAIRFANTVTVPWASSLRSARAQCPNHSFYWQILQDAIEEAGAAEFDFGRSTVGSGTYSFKKQWTADLRPLDWTFWSSKGKPEREYYLDPKAHSALRRIWSRSPLGITNTFGPLIRSKLPN